MAKGARRDPFKDPDTPGVPGAAILHARRRDASTPHR